jgi:hypothetical protein
MVRLAAALTGLALALGACATTGSIGNGASKLPGQNLDAAVALYGPWTEEITPEGQPMYIWRRTLVSGEEKKVCELRVTLGFKRTIGDVIIQGQPDACRLFQIKYVQSSQ